MVVLFELVASDKQVHETCFFFFFLWVLSVWLERIFSSRKQKSSERSNVLLCHSDVIYIYIYMSFKNNISFLKICR